MTNNLSASIKPKYSESIENLSAINTPINKKINFNQITDTKAISNPSLGQAKYKLDTVFSKNIKKNVKDEQTMKIKNNNFLSYENINLIKDKEIVGKKKLKKNSKIY